MEGSCLTKQALSQIFLYREKMQYFFLYMLKNGFLDPIEPIFSISNLNFF